MSIHLFHPRFATLVAFEEGRLRPRRHTQVAAQVRQCPKCQQSYRFIRRVSTAAAQIGAADMPSVLLTRILKDRASGERILLPAPKPLPPGRQAVRSLTSIAAAAVAVFLLLLSLTPDGLSASSSRIVHSIVHKVGPLRSIVDPTHDDSIVRARLPRAPAPPSIQVYPLTEIDAESPEQLRSISTVKVFSDGSALVHDPAGRSLRLYDSTLTASTLVAGVEGGKFSYGPQVSILVPYWGDSALFLDNASSAFIVLDANGNITRTIALPIGSDWLNMMAGQPALDPSGRLYYKKPVIPPGSSPNPLMRVWSHNADSSYIVRADFDTRLLDTVATIATGGVTRTPTVLPSGSRAMLARINPVAAHDDWTVLADGSLAIIRGRDYHVDWIRPDGTRASSGKMPFDWRRLDEFEKRRLIDSAQNALEESVMRNAAVPVTREQARERFSFVPMDSLPDFYPPIRVGSRRADLRGNLWIPPTTTLQPTGGGLIYDNVDQAGRLGRRVLLRPGYSIAGFGPGGAVYLIRSDSTGVRIARARVSSTPRQP